MKDDDRLQQQSSHRHAARMMMERDGLVKATWARVGKMGEVDNDDDDDDNNNNSRSFSLYRFRGTDRNGQAWRQHGKLYHNLRRLAWLRNAQQSRVLL